MNYCQSVGNAIQETKRGPWIIQIAVAEPLMKDDYPFHLPPSFFTYSNAINLDVKLSIIQALAQDYSIQKTYYVQSFLNQFAKRRHSSQAKIKREIIHEFHNLMKFKIIKSRFLFQGKDNQQIIEKDLIEIEDLISSKYIIFYEIITPISKKVHVNKVHCKFIGITTGKNYFNFIIYYRL